MKLKRTRSSTFPVPNDFQLWVAFTEALKFAVISIIHIIIGTDGIVVIETGTIGLFGRLAALASINHVQLRGCPLGLFKFTVVFVCPSIVAAKRMVSVSAGRFRRVCEGQLEKHTESGQEIEDFHCLKVS